MCLQESEGGEGDGREVVKGVRMKDVLTGEEWDVRAKVVINATGTCTAHVCTCSGVNLYRMLFHRDYFSFTHCLMMCSALCRSLCGHNKTHGR